MNRYQARELADEDGQPTGKWQYTVRNDDRTYPVGYCAEACPGHDTPDGAYEHQRQYDLDNATFDQTFGSWNPCKVCGELTDRGASWGIGHMSVARLCDAHRNREALDPFVSVGRAISSD